MSLLPPKGWEDVKRSDYNLIEKDEKEGGLSDSDIEEKEINQKGNNNKKRKREKVRYTVEGGDDDTLTVKAIKADAEKELPFDTKGVLPRPPFRAAFVAPPNSGKTTLILNLILRKIYGYKDYFKKIVIWSKTLLQDPMWSALPNDLLKKAYDNFDNELIQKEWDEAAEDVKKNGKTPDNARLFIIDDSMAQLNKRGGGVSITEELCSRFRHDNGSIIFVSQAYMKLPKVMRITPSNICFWQASNKTEVVDLWKEHSNGLEFEQFYDLCKHVWSHPHAFLHINYQFSPPRFFLSFEKRLHLKTLMDSDDEDEEQENHRWADGEEEIVEEPQAKKSKKENK